MSRLVFVLSYVRYVLLMSSMSMFLLNVNKVFLICQYKQKGVQLGGFVGQFACSWAGADPENIISGCGEWGGRGLSLTDILVVLYLLFTECSN